MTAREALERYYLETRSKIIDIAANLDRMDRMEGSVDEDSRRGLIDDALRILLESRPNRAEAIQMLFSRPYDSNWFAEFSKTNKRA